MRRGGSAIDEDVFSRKRSLAQLHSEVRKTIQMFSFQPVSKRVLYLHVDFHRETEGYYDAAVLYYYLLVLREAVAKVDGNLAGVLISGTPGRFEYFWGVIHTADYIMEFERRFPEVRQAIDLGKIQKAVNRLEDGNEEGDYETLFERVHINANTSLTDFFPHILHHAGRIGVVAEGDVEKLPRRLPELMSEQIEYLVVQRHLRPIAVVPLARVAASVAKAVAERMQDQEALQRKDPRR